MKKFLSILICAAFALAAVAQTKAVYVNPLQNDGGLNDVVAKRLYKKGILGLTKAKTISVAAGDAITPGSAEAANYDYILTMNITKYTIEEAGTVNNLLGALGSSSAKKDPDYEGRIYTEITIADAKTGAEAFKTTLQPLSTDKDKNTAIFDATNNFDYDMTDMTDDAFQVCGEVVEATELNKKNIVKKARVQVGSKSGARKNQAYELYKVVEGTEPELIGYAKCEQVLGPEESIISINGKKDADKVVSDLIQNNDGSYTIQALSRSRSGFLHDNFQGFDKMFTKEGRPSYLDPMGRTSKPRVAFLEVAINDNNFSAQKDLFQQTVLEGLNKVTTIVVEPTIYSDVQSARNAGIDGLVEITVDKVNNDTEKTKEGKTNYKTEIFYTVSGIDVANNKWIDMKSFSGTGSSTEGKNKSNADALGLMDNNIQKYCEDIFPVAGAIINTEEVNKNAVKKVRINIGTDMGLKKGMPFEIYEQRKEGGDDSRFLLGEGKVEKDGLSATEAILKVKGKNDGDEKIYTLLQNADDNTEIILISKASRDILDKGLDFLGRGN